MKSFVTSLIFFSISTTLVAQNNTGSVKGRVLTSDGEPAAYVSVEIKQLNLGTVTDEHGNYSLVLPEGTHLLSLRIAGHKPVEKEVVVNKGETTLAGEERLSASAHALEEVEVLGKTLAEKQRDQSYAVNVIDSKKLYNTSSDLNQVLNKTAGVRVREEGGLGSSFNFSLNGFSGRQVKFFLDGIPMDNFGASLTLNNIPINLAERIEVYKGVVPIWLGSDALGGAINIITNQNRKNFLDVSYSYGSFNTHRGAINAGYTNKKNGLAFNVNAFQNYSDNDYWVDVNITNLSSLSLGPVKRVRRFHDTYRSETMQVEGGIMGKKLADKLLIGVILSQNDKDIQTAFQMSKVYGHRAQHSNTVMPTLKYKKSNLLIKGLDIHLYGSYNFGASQTIDTINRVYNWAGEYKDNSRGSDGKYVPGAEDSRTMIKFRNNAAIASANLSYTFHKSHSLGFNYVFSNFDRVGNDVLKPNDETNRQPQMLKKSVFGLGYKLDLFQKWSTSIFAKQYLVDGESTQKVDIYTNPRWEPVSSNKSHTGYGLASSFFVFHFLQVKASFEKTYRLPEGEELFGDGVNQVSNKNLRPEQSANINAGFIFNKKFFSDHQLTVEGNVIYRTAKDFIRTDVMDTRSQSVNIRGVRNNGFDADFRYGFRHWLTFNVNATYQMLINTQKYENPNSKLVSDIYLDQIPNIPYLFGNADLGIRLNKIGFTHAHLGFSYNLSYVDQYYLKWPSQGSRSGKSFIPRQISHNLAATYSLKNGHYNVSLEARNFADARLYDNFLMQKPGRALFVKLRYFISK